MPVEPGRFCWHEMVSTDADKSKSFYTELFGWKIEDVDMGPMGSYSMIQHGESGMGGIMSIQPGQEIPSHWIGYVTVDDVDAATERAKGHGGKICVEPMDIPNMGRFAVIQDPTGAFSAPWKGLHDDVEPEFPLPSGVVCWNELLTRDVEGSRAFYGVLYGWTHAENDMGEMGIYTMFKRGESFAAGMMKMPEEAPAPGSHWLPYILVDDVDATAAKVEALGGMLCVKPFDIPNIGRSAVALDTNRAAFGIYKGV